MLHATNLLTRPPITTKNVRKQFSHQNLSDEQRTPQLSENLLNKLVIITATLLIISACMYAGANFFGDDISRGGHSISTKKIAISIGPDRLQIHENAIRFRHQRSAGQVEKLELYLQWPSLSGYTDGFKDEFNQGVDTSNLVFLTLEPRNMSYDMSGRVGLIYSRFFVGVAENQPYGLVRQPLSAEDGFIDEDLYYEATSPYPYAARCIKDTSKIATPFCIRDINVGQNMMLTYRFHKKFLPQWNKLEQALRAHIKALSISL